MINNLFPLSKESSHTQLDDESQTGPESAKLNKSLPITQPSSCKNRTPFTELLPKSGRTISNNNQEEQGIAEKSLSLGNKMFTQIQFMRKQARLHTFFRKLRVCKTEMKDDKSQTPLNQTSKEAESSSFFRTEKEKNKAKTFIQKMFGAQKQISMKNQTNILHKSASPTMKLIPGQNESLENEQQQFQYENDLQMNNNQDSYELGNEYSKKDSAPSKIYNLKDTLSKVQNLFDTEREKVVNLRFNQATEFGNKPKKPVFMFNDIAVSPNGKILLKDIERKIEMQKRSVDCDMIEPSSSLFLKKLQQGSLNKIMRGEPQSISELKKKQLKQINIDQWQFPHHNHHSQQVSNVQTFSDIEKKESNRSLKEIINNKRPYVSGLQKNIEMQTSRFLNQMDSAFKAREQIQEQEDQSENKNVKSEQSIMFQSFSQRQMDKIQNANPSNLKSGPSKAAALMQRSFQKLREKSSPAMEASPEKKIELTQKIEASPIKLLFSPKQCSNFASDKKQPETQSRPGTQSLLSQKRKYEKQFQSLKFLGDSSKIHLTDLSVLSNEKDNTSNILDDNNPSSKRKSRLNTSSLIKRVSSSKNKNSILKRNYLEEQWPHKDENLGDTSFHSFTEAQLDQYYTHSQSIQKHINSDTNPLRIIKGVLKLEYLYKQQLIKNMYLFLLLF